MIHLPFTIYCLLPPFPPQHVHLHTQSIYIICLVICCPPSPGEQDPSTAKAWRYSKALQQCLILWICITCRPIDFRCLLYSALCALLFDDAVVKCQELLWFLRHANATASQNVFDFDFDRSQLNSGPSIAHTAFPQLHHKCVNVFAILHFQL